MALKDIREALWAYLVSDASILAVVGGSAALARIYPVRLPQGQKQPSVVYNRISAIGDHHMEGASGLAQTRMQIDCWAQRQSQAVELADLVKERLDGITRTEVTFGSASPSDALIIQGIFFQNEFEDYDADAELFRVSRDFMIHYEER